MRTRWSTAASTPGRRPAAFRPEHHHALAAHHPLRQLEQRSGRVHVRPEDPEACGFQLVERADQVRDAGRREPLDGARAGSRHRGRERRAVAIGQQQAARAGRLGHPRDRAEVLGVLDLVEGDQQARRGRRPRRAPLRSAMGRGPAARTTPWWFASSASPAARSPALDLLDRDAGCSRRPRAGAPSSGRAEPERRRSASSRRRRARSASSTGWMPYRSSTSRRRRPGLPARAALTPAASQGRVRFRAPARAPPPRDPARAPPGRPTTTRSAPAWIASPALAVRR